MKWRIFLALLSFVVLNSCSNGIYKKNKPFFKGTFLKIEKFVKIRACHPLNPKHCVTKTYNSTASSFLVSHKKDKSYFITSGHVCHNDYGRLVYLPNFKTEEVIYGLDLNLKKYKYKVVSIDHRNDLCLLSSKRTKLKPYKIAKKRPHIGETIYNIAAPQDIFSKGMAPLFTGMYSGHSHDRLVFTLPAINGSSGSPILNEKGEVVGVVSAVTKNFPNIVISSTLESVKEILTHGIP